MRVAETQLIATAAPAAGVVVRHSWQKHPLTFVMVFGPGLTTPERCQPRWRLGASTQATPQPNLNKRSDDRKLR